MKPLEHARLIAEQMWELNHATAGPQGYEWPGELDEVLAELRLMALRLEQALDQARTWLIRAHAAGRVGHDGLRVPATTDTDLNAVVERASFLIREASVRSEWLAVDLSEVRSVTTRLMGLQRSTGMQPPTTEDESE